MLEFEWDPDKATSNADKHGVNEGDMQMANTPEVNDELRPEYDDVGNLNANDTPPSKPKRSLRNFLLLLAGWGFVAFFIGMGGSAILAIGFNQVAAGVVVWLIFGLPGSVMAFFGCFGFVLPGD